MNLFYPDQLAVLSIHDLADYQGRVARQYQALRARYDDEGEDVRDDMLELGSHLALVARTLADRVGAGGVSDLP